MTRQRDLFPHRPAPRATVEPFQFVPGPECEPDPDYKPPAGLEIPWIDFDPREKKA